MALDLAIPSRLGYTSVVFLAAPTAGTTGVTGTPPTDGLFEPNAFTPTLEATAARTLRIGAAGLSDSVGRPYVSANASELRRYLRNSLF